MYNCQTYEYREIYSSDYLIYQDNANYLLELISEWTSILISEITYTEVIDYFIKKFDIEIVYFDKNYYQLRRQPYYINDQLIEVSPIFSKRVSGFTVTDGSSYKIFLQHFKNNQRIIYTLLHELVHIFFHCSNKKYMKIFASMEVDEQYSDEIIPFEDEANVIASFLYLNEERLVQYLDEGCSFDTILSRHNISRSALHNRLNNYLTFTLELNPKTALYSFLLPYKKEVFGSTAIANIQFAMACPKNFLQFMRT